MRQKTINLRNQGSFDKKFDFFPQTLSHILRWVRLVQKTRAKNSHAWAPLNKCSKKKKWERERSRTAGLLTLSSSGEGGFSAMSSIIMFDMSWDQQQLSVFYLLIFSTLLSTFLLVNLFRMLFVHPIIWNRQYIRHRGRRVSIVFKSDVFLHLKKWRSQ